MNSAVFERGTKSNSNTTALNVPAPARPFSCPFPGWPLSWPALPELFGPGAIVIGPEQSITPPFIPILLAAPLKRPAASGAPVSVALETVMPGPAKDCARSIAVWPAVTVSCAYPLNEINEIKTTIADN